MTYGRLSVCLDQFLQNVCLALFITVIGVCYIEVSLLDVRWSVLVMVFVMAQLV